MSDSNQLGSFESLVTDRFELRAEWDGSILVITLVGDLTNNLIPEARNRLDNLLSSKRRLKAVFDFSDLEYITSVGCGLLARLAQRIEDTSGKVAGVESKSQSVHSVFSILRFGSLVNLTTDLETAKKTL